MFKQSGAFPGFSLRDFVTALFYYKRPTFLAFLIPCALGLAAGTLARTSYVAQARLLVLYGSEYVFHPGNRDTGNDITLDRNQIIQGELQILQSPALAAEVVAELGPEAIYPSGPRDGSAVPAAVGRLASDFAITSIPQSNGLELNLRNADRRTALRVLQSLISHYLTYRVGIFAKTRVPVGVEAERDQFAERLRLAEETLARFGIEHDISNVEEQISLQLRQKADNANAQSATREQIEDDAARVEVLHRQIATVPPTVQVFAESTRSQQSTAALESLAKLEAQRRDLMSRYQDDFPLVRDMDRQIAAVRVQLAADPAREGIVARTGRNALYDDLHREEMTLSAQLQGLRARQAQLEADRGQIQLRNQELTGLARTYRDLQRSRDVLDQSYRSIARSSEETALSDALERARGANVRVVQPPDAPLTGRNLRTLLWGGAVLFGLLTAAAVLLVLNATRQVFISVRDVERQLDLPVLLAVPTRSAPAPRPASRGGRRQRAPQPSYGV